MGFVDGVIVLCILAVFGYTIFVKITKKNPELLEKLDGFMPGHLKEKVNDSEERLRLEQIYPERRQIM